MLENGIINVNKPEGLTSHDVVAKLRRKLHIKRVGHTGTLDPMATGVLPICFGTATRVIEYYDGDYKTYIAEMKLGITTDTLDITGTVIEECNDVPESAEVIEAAFGKMTGVVTQVPPKYSALKVNGKRLYEYAREGQEVEIKGREIYIESINLIDVNLEERTVKFDVTCSKGTYIRTICDDIGQMLGCGACMTSLVRTRSGVFDIENAYDLDEILGMEEHELAGIVLDMEDTLANLGIVVITDDRVKPYMNGMSTSIRRANVVKEPNKNLKCDRADWFSTLYAVYDRNNKFLGVSYLAENGELKPSKIMKG